MKDKPNPPNCEYKKLLTPNLMPCSYRGFCEYKKLFMGMGRNRAYCWYDKIIREAESEFNRERTDAIRDLEGSFDGNNI